MKNILMFQTFSCFSQNKFRRTCPALLLSLSQLLRCCRKTFSESFAYGVFIPLGQKLQPEENRLPIKTPTFSRVGGRKKQFVCSCKANLFFRAVVPSGCRFWQMLRDISAPRAKGTITCWECFCKELVTKLTNWPKILRLEHGFYSVCRFSCGEITQKWTGQPRRRKG